MRNDAYRAQRIAQEGDRGHITGLGEVLRAARLYLGLSKTGIALKLSMAERSYTRMERGERPVPPGVLESLDEAMDEFDTAVELLIERATRSGDLAIEVSAEPEGEWHRAVVGRACVESRRITPTLLASTPREDRHSDRR
jgi:transcriptional regulator with XRE-family HTH domain